MSVPSFQMQSMLPTGGRPGQNASIQGAQAPGVRPGVVQGANAQVPAGMREVFEYDANGNRMRRLVPIAPQGGAQTPQSGAGGTGAVSSNPTTPTPPGPPQGNTPAQNPQNPHQPIDPVDVQVGRPTLNSFEEYRNAVMDQERRRLDPQFQAAEERFRQDMVNRGLQEGTAAYDRARANFDRAKNDAYQTAQNNAFAASQAAQQQAFQQNFAESNLANQLLRQREQNNTQLTIGGWNNEQSARNAEIQRQNFLDQLGFNREQAGVSADQWNRQFGFGQQQWADQFGMQQGNQDFQQYMQMLGFDRDTLNMNNNAGNTQFQQLMSMFGAIAPQMQGASPVDYLSALGMNQNQQNANYQTGVNQANQNNANWLALAGALFCDEEAKTVTGEVEPERCLEIVREIPLVSFTYKADISQTAFVGTMAQPFNRMLHGTSDPYIRTMDVVAVLLGSIKALTERLDRLEAA